ncbi:MAG: uroporphyrinogen-III synthase [Sphingomicrobium sp.]
MRRVIVLRPEPGASETVARARQLGLDAVAMPLFEIEPLDWAAPSSAAFDGLLLTSANAVRQAGDQLHLLRKLPVYAVGEATAAAAREAGLNVAETGASGVEALLGSISPDLNLLHLCGEDRTVPAAARPVLTAVPVYRASRRAPPDLGAARGAVVLVHSPRAGQRLAELVADRASIAIVAISPAAAAGVGDGWRRIAIADEPSDQALLALVARLCNNTGA